MERLKPEQNKEFERLCRDFIAWEYEREKLYGDEKKTYNHFTLYGRSGERQYGCDVTDQDKRLIVQCKCYDNYDPKAHQRLIDAVKEDYVSACSHFPKMERFVVCTNLDAKRTTQDALSKPNEIEQAPKEAIEAIANEIPIDVWFWGDLERMPGGILADNWNYAEDYEKPLFLHKNNPNVCLHNLFILQKYKEIRSDSAMKATEVTGSEKKTALWDRIGMFVQDTEQNLLILEGDAGSGKTSLVQALCWYDRENDETVAAVLDCRPLLTIRLRDLDKEVIMRKGLLTAILDGLGICTGLRPQERKAELLRRFPRAVLVLDGFDELCIIDGMEDYETLLYGLSRERMEEWKFIVTSRPNYIRRGINISAAILELQHFDQESRDAWIANYTDPALCGQSLGEDLLEFIQEGKGEGVCDAPLTLYLLAAAKDIGPEDRENLWRLYQRIFQEELVERRYDSGDHPGAKYRVEAYRLAGEVAHRMYEGSNRELWVRGTELEALAEKVLEFPSCRRHKITARDLAERCAALCCYWRAQTTRGAVEFYHNNIRDFFLCEYIYDRLNRIYRNEDQSPEQKVKAILIFFRGSFRVAKLEPIIVEFIYLRALWGITHGQQDFPAMEREQNLLPRYFQMLLTDGTIFDGMQEKHLIPTIIAIVNCSAQVFRASLEPFLEEDEWIIWWTDVNAVNNAQLLRAVVSEKTDLRNADFFHGVPLYFSWNTCGDYSRIDFAFANLTDVDLRRANLQKADLRGAVLREASLGKANLREANLWRADLRDAELQNAYLQGTKMQLADFQDANLRGADLRYADLQEARMCGADLQETDLRKAYSLEANLYHAHLQRSNLQGADLRGVDLRGADLRGVDLQTACLQAANLQAANLEEADLQGGDLQAADLRNADLQKADLRRANLRAADLRGATLPDGFCSSGQKTQLAHLRKMNIDGLTL